MNTTAVLLGYGLVVALLIVVYLSLEKKLVSINEALSEIKAALTEATTELVGKIATLEEQLAKSDTVDPALLAEVGALAKGLANIVDTPTPAESRVKDDGGSKTVSAPEPVDTDATKVKDGGDKAVTAAPVDEVSPPAESTRQRAGGDKSVTSYEVAEEDAAAESAE